MIRLISRRLPWLAVATAIGLAVGINALVEARATPFGTIHVAANRAAFTGTCPAAITFTGTIDFTMPHPQGFSFNYTWKRSDGATTKPVDVQPAADKKSLVVKETWNVGAKGQTFDVSETLNVASGNTHASGQSPSVHITCK